MWRIFCIALLLLANVISAAEAPKEEAVPGWDSVDTSQDCAAIRAKRGPMEGLKCVTEKLTALQQQMESLDNSSALKAATVALQRQFDSKLKAQQQQNEAAIAELKQQNEVLQQQVEELQARPNAKVQASQQQSEAQGKQLSAQVQALRQRVDDLTAQEETFSNRLGRLTLQSTVGTTVTGPVNGWSARSVCPTGYIATGLSKIDLLGEPLQADVQVNDFNCDSGGCAAWCASSSCNVIAQCIKLEQ